MKQISAPPSLSGAPLAELKRWLSIGTAQEDELLTGLIAAALALCERFTGTVPFKCEVRETMLSAAVSHRLSATPCIALIDASAIDGLDARLLADSDYSLTLEADGSATFTLTGDISEATVELRYYAGAASEWEDLDEGLRHGVIRHAAHCFRERERGEPGQLPASIAALWRPWRKLRL